MQKTYVAQWNNSNIVADNNSFGTGNNRSLSSFQLMLCRRRSFQFQPIHMEATDKLIRIDQVNEFRVFQSLQLSFSDGRNGKASAFEGFHFSLDVDERKIRLIHICSVSDTVGEILEISQFAFHVCANGDLSAVGNCTDSRRTIHHRTEIIHSSSDRIDFAYRITVMTSHSNR